MPDRLFHYQRFVEQHLVSLLSGRTVKLSRPDRFNDPWDCRVHYRVPTSTAEKERVFDWLKTEHRKRQPLVGEAERAQLAQQTMADLSSLVEKMESGMYSAICNRYRVYCLSEHPDSALMWAHYADSHTGVCLEFDAQKAPFTRATGATKVTYSKAYPDPDLCDTGYKPLITKSDDWAYESEWRLIAEERAFATAPVPPGALITDNDFLTLPAGVLSSVTIGCLASDTSRRQVEHLVRIHAPGVLVRQAALARDRYQLRIDPPF
jgi:hypothetical protein